MKIAKCVIKLFTPLVAAPFSFVRHNITAKFQPGYRSWGHQIQVYWEKFVIFDQSLCRQLLFLLLCSNLRLLKLGYLWGYSATGNLSKSTISENAAYSIFAFTCTGYSPPVSLLLRRYTPVHSLRSTYHLVLHVPQFSTKFAKRSFGDLAAAV